MTKAEGQNGANRIGLWLSIAISAAILTSMMGATFYVAFNGKANTDAIAVINIQQRDADAKNAALQDRLTKIEVAMNEIETQFCAQDVVRNLMHANDMRNISLLWEKIFGTKYPTDNSYYPNICNRKTK